MEIPEVKFCTSQGAGTITAKTVQYYLIQGLKLLQLAIDPVKSVNLREYFLGSVMKVIKYILEPLWKAITGRNPGDNQAAEEVGYPHKDSIEELLPLVKGEDTDTQYTLGSMYHDGKGGPQDFQQAFKWYERAAEQGNSDAQYCLGMMYDEGKGIPQDYQEALKWIRRAAEQGDSRSQFLLGVNYESGDRAPNDYVLALSLIHI